MQILMLVDEEFYPKIGGSAFEQWEFSRRAAAAGHDITVYMPRRSGQARRETVDGVEVRRPIRSHQGRLQNDTLRGLGWRILYNLRLFVRLMRWIRANDPDVVYSVAYMTHPVAKLLGMRTGTPVANYVQYLPSTRTDEGLGGRLVKVSERLVHGRLLGDLVFCKLAHVKRQLEEEAANSPTIRQLEPTFNAGKVRAVVRNGAGSGVRERFDIPKDEVLLTFVGRFVDVKNVAQTVEAVADLPDGYNLVLVGEGPAFDRVKSRIKDVDAADRIHTTGALPHEEALAVIAASDGLLLPSDNEVDPTVVYEALGLNKRVFATRVGTVAETPHENLEHVEPEGLAAAIESAEFDNVDAALDEGVLERYDVETFVADVLDAMEEFVAE